jgi:hypothetical protein
VGVVVTEQAEPFTEREAELISLMKEANDCLHAYEGINLAYHMDDHPEMKQRLEEILSHAGARL